MDVKDDLVPKSIRYPKYTSVRAVMISHLYTKVYNIICRSFKICGLKDFQVHIFKMFFFMTKII